MACVTSYRGKWAVDFREFGRRRRVSFSTKGEAQKFLREIQLRRVDLASGTSKVSPVSVQEATERYLKTITSKKTSGKAIVGEAKYMARLDAFFYGYLTTEVRLQDLEELQGELSTRLKPSTVNRHFNCYRHFFGKCVDWKFIRENPCDRLKALRQSAVRRRVLTIGELAQLLEVAAPWMQQALLFIWYTGCRASEVSKLSWEDVDLAQKQVRICTKKGDGNERERLLPLSESCHQLLVNQASKGHMGPKIAVFQNASGNRVSSDHLVRETRRLAKKAELKGVSIHCLRHSFATNLSRDGQNTEVIQKLLGHTSLQTTSRYLHLVTEDLRAAVEGIADQQRKV